MTIFATIGTSLRNNQGLGKVLTFCSTGFCLGHVPKIPGTLGSLLGIPLFLLTWTWAWRLQLLSFVAFCFLAWGLAEHGERVFKESDPSCIVIDEVAGMWATFLLLWSNEWNVLIAGFLLFRFFDISKVFPIRILEAIRGGFGVVADDIAAGFMANIILRVLLLYGIL